MAAMNRSRYGCPYCSTHFDGLEPLKAHVVGAHGTEPLPRPAGAITLTVNGRGP